MKKSPGFPSWPESVRGYGLLLPTLLVLALVMAAPMVVLTVLSLWTQTDTGYDTALTLDNYVTFFDKRIYPLILMRSIKISALVALVTVLLAYPAAYFIAFHVTRHKMVWLILITLPFWTSYLLRVFAWKLILGYNGVINSGLLWLGVIEQPLDFLLYNASAVVLTLAHAWAAFAILPIYISLSKIDRSLLEAAHDLGEGPVMTFFRVTLPLSLPGVVAAALLVFIPTVGDYVTPKLVGGTTGIMIGNLIQSAFGRGDDWPLGAAISVVSMAAITLAVCIFLLGVGRLKALVR
uniref:Spermidine/putrescine transport system permease protein n=2 Tax=Candidatus Kentrum sp. FM TaxID=2126340 RepID=A0A450VVQ9_9GAMM|nr:MAG: spermidine/putrescine transport system permease protein [Candidatus Kentron sp. FM]VFJ54792.1 MAG: spermidine/putrescine transport system permease protein [Candidatus Kentron sp. FM]VFK08898.1 MAG: spermidine/putrescine transport system permease protein [Candidatus Kentron sp. FM]